MNRELLLLRHGKAEHFHEHGDFHRALRNKGKRHAQRIGTWLADRQLVLDLVISSSAERAVNTAHKCCKSMGLPAQAVQASDVLYLASAEVLLEQLRNLPGDPQRVMLVGHNPGLEHLLRTLGGTLPTPRADHQFMPPGTIAHLEIPAAWRDLQPAQARLLALQRGADLPATFPFITATGVEQRERPAYYYTQSSVIPFRVHEDELQVLMVRSSSNRHWVVPKGILDPGLSAQESAAKEALEEAGVEGHIVGDALGRYDYPKWGASCSVEVFAMQVTRELPEHRWDERQRGRQWVAAQMAAALLKQAALVPMIETLLARHAGDTCRV